MKLFGKALLVLSLGFVFAVPGWSTGIACTASATMASIDNGDFCATETVAGDVYQYELLVTDTSSFNFTTSDTIQFLDMANPTGDNTAAVSAGPTGTNLASDFGSVTTGNGVNGFYVVFGNSSGATESLASGGTVIFDITAPGTVNGGGPQVQFDVVGDPAINGPTLAPESGTLLLTMSGLGLLGLMVSLRKVKAQAPVETA